MCHTSEREMKGRHSGSGQFSLLEHFLHYLPKSSIPSRANVCGHIRRFSVGDLGAGSDSDRSCSLLAILMMMAMNTGPIFYRYIVPIGCTYQFLKHLQSQKLHVVMCSIFLMLSALLVLWYSEVFLYTVTL